MKNNKLVLGFLLGLTLFMLMGAFTRDWDESVPTDSTVANQIDEYNRYLRVDTSDRLENMFYGFIAGENTLSQHAQYIQFYEQASIAQPSAGYGRLGTLAVGGKCELHWKDEDNDLIELTEGGKLVIGYGTASQAIMWNTTEEDGENGRESQIRATGEQSGGERTTLGYLEFSHDGTSDDQKGRARIVVNDGDDSDAPSKVAIVFQADGAIDVGDSVSVLDEDAMGSDSATKVATQQSIKAYIDGLIASEVTLSAYTDEDSDSTAMLKAHAYLAATGGYVNAYVTASGGQQNIKGYVGATDDPAGAGTCVDAGGVDPVEEVYGNISFMVAEGEYFEITTTSGNAPTINWKSFGTLSKPVDQD